MTGERILIIDDSAESRAWLIESVMRPAGYVTAEAASLGEARQRMIAFEPDAVVLDAQIGSDRGLDLLCECEEIPVVVTTPHRAVDEIQAALAAGARDVLVKPFEPERLATAIARALRTTQAVRGRDAMREQVERQAQEFDALSGIGKVVTSLLYIDEILAQIVSAGVNLIHAEEGSLFLLNPDNGEVYLRANRDSNESAARSLRVKVEDALITRMIQAGRPMMLSGDDLVKVKTSCPVKSVLSAPLLVGDRVIGVLSVDHKISSRSFAEHDIHLLSTLADYAAIAIENARLFWAAENERGKLQTILRDTQDAIIVADADMRVVLANSAARAAFQLDDDAIGQQLVDVIRNRTLLDLFDQSKRRGGNWRAEIPIDDGRTLQGQLSELGGIGFGVVMQDISRLKELDRVKTEFISIVSHDLRTPLTTIRGYVELLPRVGPLNDTQREFVTRIERGTVNIVNLIADLLDVSRIEAGLDWEMELTDIVKVVRSATTSLRADADAKRQTLTVDTAALPPILGNSRRLEQVVANLVSNAIKYTPEGGRIDVSLRDDEDFVVLRVRDNGIGISADDQLRIFDKFFRVESDATMRIDGTGLGLSIVKTIVERHKGRAWVESETGTGSTFSVVLPKYASVESDSGLP